MDENELRAQLNLWRGAYLAYQEWATKLLSSLDMQPDGGEHGDGPARDIIGEMATLGCRIERITNAKRK
jgi:hypothetical protein